MTRRAALAVSLLALSLLARASHADDAPTTAPAKVQPVDFRKLKESLPAKLAGLERGEATGQRTKIAELNMTQAEAPYGKDEGENPRTARVTLIDNGDPAVAKAAAGWAAADIDQESDNEYTKTTDVQGRRALVTYNSKEKRGTLNTLGGGRIIVTLEVTGLSDAEFQKAIADLPLKALDALATAK